jgi:hypothetical protein
MAHFLCLFRGALKLLDFFRYVLHHSRPVIPRLPKIDR